MPNENEARKVELPALPMFTTRNGQSISHLQLREEQLSAALTQISELREQVTRMEQDEGTMEQFQRERAERAEAENRELRERLEGK